MQQPDWGSAHNDGESVCVSGMRMFVELVPCSAGRGCLLSLNTAQALALQRSGKVL